MPGRVGFTIADGGLAASKRGPCVSLAGLMRLTLCLLLALASSVTAVGQPAAPAPLPPLPKEPAAIFAAAAPLYDFAAPDMKPWHLKASYQLFDDKGQPTVQGTYEYWWASPGTYRSTWSRPGMEHTDWHVDGKHYSHYNGGQLDYSERKLQSDLLDPLPKAEETGPATAWLTHEDKSFGSVKLPCVMVVHRRPQDSGKPTAVPLGIAPTFCFDSDSPMLRMSFGSGISVIYNKIVRIQGKLLPSDIAVVGWGKKMLTARVESDMGILPTAPELTPSSNASDNTALDPIVISSGVAQDLVKKRVPPTYPTISKQNKEQGTVVLHAFIGTNGRIHGLTAVGGPSRPLIDEAIRTVSQWEYEPYKFNGQPAEVETTINLTFNLGS